jgi:lipopolysaccharide transport system permease protein
MADRSSIITPALRHFWDLILVLTQKELKVRYKSSVLGYVWSIANPLAFAFTFYVAFKVVMRIQMEDYALFLISGLFPWQWLANSITFSTGVFLANASIIKKVSFPRSSVVLTTVLQDMIHFALAMPVIVLFLFLYGRSPSVSWLWGIPLFLSAQFCLTYGLCLAVSSANLFFRDLERLVGILLNLIFYFTPILYPESLVPAEYRALANANPFAPLMTGWRKLFMYGELDLALLVTSAAFGGVALLGGYTIYRKLSWRFAEVL